MVRSLLIGAPASSPRPEPQTRRYGETASNCVARDCHPDASAETIKGRGNRSPALVNTLTTNTGAKLQITGARVVRGLSMEQGWMSEEEIDALQDIWGKVFVSAEDVGVIILLRLFTGHPASKQYFPMFKDLETVEELRASDKLRWHAGRIMSSLDKAVRSLRNTEELVQILRAVGLSHARKPTPIDVKYYHILVNIIMDVLLETFKDELSPTAQSAWTKLLGTLCTEIENVYRQDGLLEQATA